MIDIVFCHLLNGYTSSPRVLRGVINALSSQNSRAKLYVGSDGSGGVLEDCGIPMTRYRYIHSNYKIVSFVNYLLSQIYLFLALVNDQSIDRNAIIYVNTLLPFGAALFGKLTGRKVIYHIHEMSMQPKLPLFFLRWIARMASSKNIYISKAQALALPIANVPAIQIYNALDKEFEATASQSVYQSRRDGVFNILMIASLRDDKGIPELLSIASLLEHRKDIQFLLVVNDEQGAIDRYFSGKVMPSNLKVYPRTKNPAEFYQRASLVLNLSRVDLRIETFGLTILEAMAFGVPVIAPPVGGPRELINEPLEGFVVDSRDTVLLIARIVDLAKDSESCDLKSNSARKRSKVFSSKVFTAKLRQVLMAD